MPPLLDGSDHSSAVEAAPELSVSASHAQNRHAQSHTSKKRRHRGVLAGLDTRNMLPTPTTQASIEAEIPEGGPQPTNAPKRLTRQSLNGRADALYDAKYHPMDQVMRPKRAAKRLSGRQMVPLLDTDDDGGTDEGNLPSSAHGTEFESTEQDSSTDDDSPNVRKPDSRATRVSSRVKNQKLINYSAKHHPQDSHIPGFQHKARQQRKQRKRCGPQPEHRPSRKSSARALVIVSSEESGRDDDTNTADPRGKRPKKANATTSNTSSAEPLIDSTTVSLKHRGSASSPKSIHDEGSDDVELGAPDDSYVSEDDLFPFVAHNGSQEQDGNRHDPIIDRGDGDLAGHGPTSGTHYAPVHPGQLWSNFNAINRLRPSMIVEDHDLDGIEPEDSNARSSQSLPDFDDEHLAPFESTQKSTVNLTGRLRSTAPDLYSEYISNSSRPAANALRNDISSSKTLVGSSHNSPGRGRSGLGHMGGHERESASYYWDNEHDRSPSEQESAKSKARSRDGGAREDLDGFDNLAGTYRESTEAFDVSRAEEGNPEAKKQYLLDGLDSAIARATQQIDEDERL